MTLSTCRLPEIGYKGPISVWVTRPADLVRRHDGQGEGHGRGLICGQNCNDADGLSGRVRLTMLAAWLIPARSAATANSAESDDGSLSAVALTRGGVVHSCRTP